MKTTNKVVVRLMRHLQSLQTKINQPSTVDATEEEVLTLFSLLWEWTSQPKYPLPSKSDIEHLVALFRGCAQQEYAYISGERVAQIIRKSSGNLGVRIGKNEAQMSDQDFYRKGHWNYRPSSFVSFLSNIQRNP